MSSKVQVHVGTLADMGERFANAWNRATAGEPQKSETHVTFLGLQSMLDTLTTKRLELLRHLHQHGADSVRSLAQALARDYKNVHEDVAALEAVGLIEREGRKLAAPWSEIQATLTLA